MDALDRLRVILVHDWLTGMRGGEKVLEVFCRRWPWARLYTLLHRRGSVSQAIEKLDPVTSFLQWLPGVHRYYRYLLPLMPRAVNWRLPNCDLVLSSSHCVAKGAKAPPGVPHVCYCYTPMRYAWHMKAAYFSSNPAGGGMQGWIRGLKARVVDRLMERLRNWDQETAIGVTHFLAISREVQRRIKECYGRSSIVIYPPVDTEFYCPGEVAREDYYLVVSAMAPYKRLDLAIEACGRLRRKLVVIGTGQDEKKLRALAGPTVTFLGWQKDEVIRDHFRRCRALLFPGEEDFGIVPVEAQACGAPVIALGRGGARETVVPIQTMGETIESPQDEPTGLWFQDQTAECLMEALENFEKLGKPWDGGVLRRQALRFQASRFSKEIFGYLAEILEERKTARPLAA